MKNGKQKASFVRRKEKGWPLPFCEGGTVRFFPVWFLYNHSPSKQKRTQKLTLSALRRELCQSVSGGGSSQPGRALLSMVRHGRESRSFSYSLSRISWTDIQLWEFATLFNTLLLCLDNKSGFATPATFMGQCTLKAQVSTLMIIKQQRDVWVKLAFYLWLWASR